MDGLIEMKMVANTHEQERVAVILLAKGFDGKFVNHCVADLRDAGIRTYLVGLREKIKSWHGVETCVDKRLRHLSQLENVCLVVIPGRSNCVRRLALEPKVPVMVRQVLRQKGWVAVAKSAESTLEHLTQLPPNMRILPPSCDDSQCLRQHEQTNSDFIHALITTVNQHDEFADLAYNTCGALDGHL